jgi:HK97 family phage major capsid protein
VPCDINALYAERAKCIADAGKIFDKAKAEGGRPMTGEESQEFDRLHNRADEVYGQIEAEKKSRERASRQEKAAESLRESRGRQLPAGEPGGSARGSDKVMYTFQGKPVELRISADPKLVFRASAEYGERFSAYLATGIPQASMQTDIADSGGYLAPPQFVAELVQELNNDFWFRKLARVLPPTSAPEVTMPRRTARMNQFVWSSELATPSPDTAYKLGTYKLTPHYMTGEVELSNDLIRAASIDPDSIVRNEIKFRGGELEEQAFFNGTGAGQPLGVFTPSNQGIDTVYDVTGDPTAYDTWVGAKLSLRQPYLMSKNLRWIVHRNAVRILASLKSTMGEPLWLVSTREGEPERFNGVTTVISEYAPAGTGGNNTYAQNDYLGIIGDFANYDILDGLDLSIVVLTDSYYARRNMIGYIIRRKVDGNPRIGEAFRRLKKA